MAINMYTRIATYQVLYELSKTNIKCVYARFSGCGNGELRELLVENIITSLEC